MLNWWLVCIIPGIKSTCPSLLLISHSPSDISLPTVSDALADVTSGDSSLSVSLDSIGIGGGGGGGFDGGGGGLGSAGWGDGDLVWRIK